MKTALIEYLDFKSRDDLLTEYDRKQIEDGKYIMAGVLQRSDAENANGRVYPHSILEREVENYKKLVRDRRALGELDHPEGSVVELKNTSHLVVDIGWDGKDVIGKVEILNTPSGKILQSLIDSNVTLGISSRGLGSTRQKNGVTLVEDDFQLICFDFVSDPSTHGAFMMKEGVEPKVFDKPYKINRALNDFLRSFG